MPVLPVRPTLQIFTLATTRWCAVKERDEYANGLVACQSRGIEEGRGQTFAEVRNGGVSVHTLYVTNFYGGGS